MGYRHLCHALLGAAPPAAIVACLLCRNDSAAPVVVSFAIIALALSWRLVPQSRPLSVSLAFPAVLFGLLPLLQALPLPVVLWRRLTAVDPLLQSEIAALGVTLPTTWSFQPEESIRFAILSIAALAVFLLARHAASSSHALWSLIASLISLSAWQALEGLSQHFAGMWLLPGSEVAHGHFINRGYYAALLNACLWLSGGVACSQFLRTGISPARTLLVVGSIFTALLSIAAIVASQARAALLLFALLLAAGITLLPMHRMRRAAVAISAVVCGGVFFSTPMAKSLLGRFQELYEYGGDPGRLLIWRDSLAALGPLGSGAGAFPWAFARTTPYFLRKSVDSGHSDYVEWAVEFGPFISALLAISLAASIVMLLVRAHRLDEPERRTIALGAGFGATALALHGLADSILHFPALMFLLACLLGLAFGLTKRVPKGRQRLGTGLLSAGLCAATLFLGSAFAQRSFGKLFASARVSQLAGDTVIARQDYAYALRANPRAAAAWLGLSEIARSERDLQLALRYAQLARSVEPFTYRAEWALADLQLATGDVTAGVETLRVVCGQLADLSPAAYLLAFRAGVSLETIESRLTTPDPYAVGEYLAFLIRTGNAAQVPAARERLVNGQGLTLSEAHERYIANHGK